MIVWSFWLGLLVIFTGLGRPRRLRAREVVLAAQTVLPPLAVLLVVGRRTDES